MSVQIVITSPACTVHTWVCVSVFVCYAVLSDTSLRLGQPETNLEQSPSFGRDKKRLSYSFWGFDSSGLLTSSVRLLNSMCMLERVCVCGSAPITAQHTPLSNTLVMGSDCCSSAHMQSSICFFSYCY